MGIEVIQRGRAAVVGAALLFAIAPATSAQDVDPGLIIGRAIAAGVLLASDDFASSGSYDGDPASETALDLHQFGGRHSFERFGRWQPFVGARIGRLLVDQRIDLPIGAERGDVDFDFWTLSVEGGARVGLSRGFFAEIAGEVSYSQVEDRLRYPSPEVEAILGPVIDGVLFNFDTEVLGLVSSALVGWERRPVDRTAVILSAEIAGLHTDPIETEDPVQDRTVDTHFERLTAEVEVPLRARLFDRPLRLDARTRMAFLGEDLEEPLDSSWVTDLRVELVALWPDESKLPISALGLAVTYTTSDNLEGWSIGLALGR